MSKYDKLLYKPLRYLEQPCKRPTVLLISSTLPQITATMKVIKCQKKADSFQMLQGKTFIQVLVYFWI